MSGARARADLDGGAVTPTGGEDEALSPGDFRAGMGISIAPIGPFRYCIAVYGMPGSRPYPTTAARGHARLSLVGREVAVLSDEMLESGDRPVPFSGAGLPSGAYFLRYRGADGVRIGSVVVARRASPGPSFEARGISAPWAFFFP